MDHICHQSLSSCAGCEKLQDKLGVTSVTVWPRLDSNYDSWKPLNNIHYRCQGSYTTARVAKPQTRASAGSNCPHSPLDRPPYPQCQSATSWNWWLLHHSYSHCLSDAGFAPTSTWLLPRLYTWGLWIWQPWGAWSHPTWELGTARLSPETLASFFHQAKILILDSHLRDRMCTASQVGAQVVLSHTHHGLWSRMDMWKLQHSIWSSLDIDSAFVNWNKMRRATAVSVHSNGWWVHLAPGTPPSHILVSVGVICLQNACWALWLPGCLVPKHSQFVYLSDWWSI